MYLIELQVHAIGPSDHSDKFSNKVYTERVDCSPTYILLYEIVNKCITSAMLAAMISSANTKIYFRKGPSKIKSAGKL